MLLLFGFERHFESLYLIFELEKLAGHEPVVFLQQAQAFDLLLLVARNELNAPFEFVAFAREASSARLRSVAFDVRVGQDVTLLAEIIRQARQMLLECGDVARSMLLDAVLQFTIVIVDRSDLVQVLFEVGVEMTKFFRLRIVRATALVSANGCIVESSEHGARE